MDYCIISQLNYTNPKKTFMYILMLLSMQKKKILSLYQPLISHQIYFPSMYASFSYWHIFAINQNISDKNECDCTFMDSARMF